MKQDDAWCHFRAPLIATMAAAASLLIAPVVSAVIDLPTVEVAYAKGGQGGGNGQGGGGGHGGGHGGGNSASAGQGGGGSPAGTGSGRALGRGRDIGNSSVHDDDGISAEALGRLNAANAAQPALDNAAWNSAVGMIAAYQDVISVEGFDIEEAAEALAAAANKPIDSSVVTTVNGLLGIELDPAIDDAIADAAAALQAPEAVEEAGGDPVQ